MKRKVLLFLLFIGWLVFFFTVFALQTTFGVLTLQQNSKNQAEKSLLSYAIRVQKDMHQRIDQTWDISLFNSDPTMPYPNVSGPFPLYVMTLNGFIISRTNPIAGFLDTVDQNTMLHYSVPQTIQTVTNESWRVLTKQILIAHKQQATVIVAYFQPRDSDISDTDTKLSTSVTIITDNLKVIDNKLDASSVDIRHIPYDISFEIIDKTGSTVLSNGRLPTYIDGTYVYRELNNIGFKEVVDGRTHETFLVLEKPLLESNRQTGGLIAVGKSIQSNQILIQDFLSATIFTDSIQLIIFTIVAFFGTLILAKLLHIHQEDVFDSIRSVSYDKKGQLFINEKIYVFDMDSIQNQLLSILFSKVNSSKQDSLQDVRFSEDKKESKKFYDAHIGINKKVGFQLVVYNTLNKSFSLQTKIKNKFL